MQTSINEPSLSLETVGGQRWRRKSGEAGERPGFASLTEVAKVVTEAAIAKGEALVLESSSFCDYSIIPYECLLASCA